MKRLNLHFAVVAGWAFALALMPRLVSAQASGESAEAGPPTPGERTTVSARSPLWLAVEAQYRQRETVGAVPDRRLTSEQRMQLREQIRRASERHHAVTRSALESPAER